MKRSARSPARANKTFTNKNGYRQYKDSGKYVHRHVAEKTWT